MCLQAYLVSIFLDICHSRFNVINGAFVLEFYITLIRVHTNDYLTGVRLLVGEKLAVSEKNNIFSTLCNNMVVHLQVNDIKRGEIAYLRLYTSQQTCPQQYITRALC